MIEPHQHKIRSFVRRNGRITPPQKKAFEELWLKYGIQTVETPFNFPDNKKQILEIGFGMGHSLIVMAEQYPEYHFLGIDVYQPGVGAVLNAIDKKNLKNVRVMNQDATEILPHISDHSLDAVLIFFPDPWPKKRHHKRRLIQPEFVRQVAQKIKKQGYIHIATDWSPYAEHIKNVLDDIAYLQERGNHFLSLLKRPITKFEQRGEKLGHQITDFIYEML